MADSARYYKGIRECSNASAPLWGSDPPDVGESGGLWASPPRQNHQQTSHDAYIVVSDESRQERNFVDHDNVIQLYAHDPHACAIALLCDDLNRVQLNDALHADLFARGWRTQPNDAARVIRVFNARLAALRETLRLYEGAR